MIGIAYDSSMNILAWYSKGEFGPSQSSCIGLLPSSHSRLPSYWPVPGHRWANPPETSSKPHPLDIFRPLNKTWQNLNSSFFAESSKRPIQEKTISTCLHPFGPFRRANLLHGSFCLWSRSWREFAVHFLARVHSFERAVHAINLTVIWWGG